MKLSEFRRLFSPAHWAWILVGLLVCILVAAAILGAAF